LFSSWRSKSSTKQRSHPLSTADFDDATDHRLDIPIEILAIEFRLTQSHLAIPSIELIYPGQVMDAGIHRHVATTSPGRLPRFFLDSCDQGRRLIESMLLSWQPPSWDPSATGQLPDSLPGQSGFPRKTAD
jgi:hypothetical protein